ncbi:unnamed protein product [Camellia sinensis]
MWKKARTLGRGSFRLVSLAISQPNDESKLNLPSLMAVKSAETFQHHSLQKESNLLTELNDCPNILHCYGSFISNDDDNNSGPLYNMILRVGMSLAQIGEFAFVLLSRASNVHLVELKIFCYAQAMFIPSAEALDTSYFMSNYIWNPNDENVGGGSDFDDMTEACSISCSCGSCYTQDEDVLLELVENVGAISDLSRKARLFLVLPVALLDAFFILWIFTSLSATLNKLQARHMLAKLDIYRKFTNALAVAIIVSVDWICYEVYTYSGEASEEFDRDDNTLTLIKPSAMPSKDIRRPLEVGSLHGGNNGVSNSDLEEDKT